MGNKLKLLFRTPRFLLGFIILAVILSFVYIYPIVDPADPFEMVSTSFNKPGTVTWEGRKVLLGTDNFGRDVLVELVQGTKTSLFVGLIGGLTTAVIGLLIGLFSGYIGGQVDNILSAICNMFITIPSFIILVLISVSLSVRSSVLTALIIGFTGWPWLARAVRAQTISLRNRDHVNIARINGASTPRIILMEILPYVASYAGMALILAIAGSILQEASLSMLGLGPYNTMSLGTLMSWALMFTAPSIGAWWAFIPAALVISGITFAMYMVNSGLDEIFNPKIRS
jgi:peptide/nickel transport system permease protein